MSRDDPQIKATPAIWFMRITVLVLALAVVGSWVAVGLEVLTTTVAIIATVVAAVGWVVLGTIRARYEPKSGLRPEGGIRWDGNIGNPDDENPSR